MRQSNHGIHIALYDAEGRICAQERYGVYTGYMYDAAGSRIAKGSITSMSCDVTANGFTQTSAYVAGPGGEDMTEVNAAGPWQWSRTNVYANGSLIATYDVNGLHYQLNDPLGTRRVQTTSTGAVQFTYPSLPFGDGLSVPNGDATENHFTGKERDGESGNDYFLARYYNSATGRFLSPDWSAKVTPVPYAKLDDPQSLNLYSYVRNNPLSRADADGHCDAPSNLKVGQVGVCVASYISAKRFDLVGDGDNRGTNGNGGSSRIQTTFTVDLQSGATDKPKDGDQVAKSTLAGGNAPLQGTGSSQVSPGATVDTNGNMHVSVDQTAHSAYDVGGALGDISNHVKLEITPTGQVGVDAGSTARQFPSLEVYRYTTDGTTVTTTLVHNYQETSPSALRQPEQPLAPQAPQ
jgi:RHS repeat-associated protein